MSPALSGSDSINQCMRLQQSRSVRISNAPPEIFLIDRATKDEALQIWYKPRDYAHFSNECRSVIRATKERLLGFSNECTRGLEKFIYSYESRQLNQKMTVEVVLREQDRQRSLRVNDPNLLKEISTIVTGKSKELAIEMATVDEIFSATCDEQAVPSSYVAAKCNQEEPAESCWYNSWYPLSRSGIVSISSSWIY